MEGLEGGQLARRTISGIFIGGAAGLAFASLGVTVIGATGLVAGVTAKSALALSMVGWNLAMYSVGIGASLRGINVWDDLPFVGDHKTGFRAGHYFERLSHWQNLRYHRNQPLFQELA